MSQDVLIRQIQALLGGRVLVGEGAPSADPGKAAIYFRTDFGSSAAVYVWDGAWTSLT